MLEAELSASALASAVGVDVKSVARWVSEDRIPYPVTRAKVARLLNHRESFFWPSLAYRDDMSDELVAELDRIWPTRSAISDDAWHRLFSSAKAQLDILVCAGAFLLDTLDLADILSWKAGSGTVVRVLVGDPESAAVRMRASELSLPWLPERCRSTGNYLRQVVGQPNVEVRLHGTTLYASQFRFDQTVVVNTHAFEAWASRSPALQLTGTGNAGLFDFYAAAFQRVWATASRLSNAAD